ncbi:MAG: PilZ domain-containing protein [Terriglobales bacterium]|jgi:CheY-like chemotaxis protein
MTIGVALLVSSDPIAIRQVSEALREFSISPDVCQEPPAALGLLTRRKFDAIIVDLQLGTEAGLILDEARLSPSNRTAVTFAIRGKGDEDPALQNKSSFVLDRPLSADSICNTLKPAYGMILRERRRYFRCPVSIPVVIQRRAMPEVRCQSINISDGGIAVHIFAPLDAGEEVVVQFVLPGGKTVFAAESTVCWGKKSQLGIRFLSLPEERKSELQSWLARKLEETLPDGVAEKFQQ